MKLKEKFLPFVYCFLGSGMLTNTYDEGVAERNAELCEWVSDRYTLDVMEWYRAKCIISNFDMYMSAEAALELYKKERSI